MTRVPEDTGRPTVATPELVTLARKGVVSDLVEYLDAFNRKERFALIRQALGLANFTPSFTFVQALASRAGADIAGATSATAWMDYHLDWLYAALVLDATPGQATFPSPQWPGADPGADALNVNANQEDIDLLVAVTTKEKVHLFLVEAKWETAWQTAQMVSKLKRLRLLFGQHGDSHPNVVPHLVLASKRMPKHLRKKVEQQDQSLPMPWTVVGGEFAHLPLEVPGGRVPPSV